MISSRLETDECSVRNIPSNSAYLCKKVITGFFFYFSGLRDYKISAFLGTGIPVKTLVVIDFKLSIKTVHKQGVPINF